MKLKKVEATSMQEALRKLRTTLGDDAMIVGTRTLRRGGVLGVGSKEVVEVYVADHRPQGSAAPAAGRQPPPAGPAPQEELGVLSKSLSALRQEVRELVREKEGGRDHHLHRDAYGIIQERGVERKLAG